MEEILCCLMFGKSNRKYSEKLRKFFLTLHFYSPRAYRYIRRIFNNRIPTIRTIRSWYSSVDGSPGFTGEAFQILKEKSEKMKAEGKELLVCLISDEMSIRSRCEWSVHKKEYSGFITAGRPKDDDDALPIAKYVLVFMISGVNDSFKIPVAYFLVDGLETEERAVLIIETIRRAREVGAKVIAKTYDGLITNISTARFLGAKFEDDKPYFIDPTDGKTRIYCLLDPPHMLKLLRNCFASKSVFSSTGEIDWNLIERLVDLQIKMGVNLGNKINKKHLDWANHKGNVRIAAETLSQSVADSLIQLKNDGHGLFQNSIPTADFLKFINNLFDIMNSKENHNGAKFKHAMCADTIDDIRLFFQQAKNYLKELRIKVNGKIKPILKTRNFTPFFGFYHNIICCLECCLESHVV